MLTKLTIILALISEAIFGVYQNHDNNSDFDAVLKFAKYTTWTNTNPSNEFVVMIAENNESEYKAASEYFKNHGFENKQIKTVMLTNDSDISDANIIFIGYNSNIDFEKLEQKIGQKHILTISTNKDLLKVGCMFYIFSQGDELEYFYNKQAVIRSGLMIKSTILLPSHAYEQ